MPTNITQYELLISCPGDVQTEIEIIKEVVHEFNTAFSSVLGLSIQTRHWGDSSYPASGGKPQEILNKQFVNNCDAAVAIFWTRFGSPTDKYGSGTEEEIEKMLEDNKQVFMYFSDTPVSLSEVDSEQYKRILGFKEKYTSSGLYSTYTTTDDFRKQFKAHLTQYFLTLEKVEQITSAKNPEFKLAIIDMKTQETIAGQYPFRRPEILMTRRERSEDDLFDEIAEYVTLEDIQEYNAALPSVEEIEAFNTQQKLYENAHNNRFDFTLQIENSGNSKGNDIYVDLQFPNDILVYYDDEVDDISEPEDRPDMPKDPVMTALGKLEEKETNAMLNSITGLENVLEHIQWVNNLGVQMASYSPKNFITESRAIFNRKEYDYYIDNHAILSLHLDDLLHTRTYSSETFSLIFTKPGQFSIAYSIMCEEWEEPVTGKYTITVENQRE